jgi:FCD domain
MAPHDPAPTRRWRATRAKSHTDGIAFRHSAIGLSAPAAQMCRLRNLNNREDEWRRTPVERSAVWGALRKAPFAGWALRLRAVRAMHDRPEVGLSRIEEHREIVTALRARDADRVETLMRRHLTTSIDYVLKQAR